MVTNEINQVIIKVSQMLKTNLQARITKMKKMNTAKKKNMEKKRIEGNYKINLLWGDGKFTI